MPMSDRDRLAELLALHRLRLQARPKRDDAVAARCKCGVVIAYTGPPYEKRDELRHRIQLGWEQHLADALIAAGVTMPEPPAVCGASVVIVGVEYVCDREPHRCPRCYRTGAGECPCGAVSQPVHECTDGVGVMQWRDSDDGPVVVRAWTHDGSDGWPIRG